MNDKVFWNFNTSPCVAVPGCRWQKLSHEEASDMFFFVYDSEKNHIRILLFMFFRVLYM